MLRSKDAPSTQAAVADGAAPGVSAMGETLRFTITTRDRFGNLQFNNADNERFHVYAVAERSTQPAEPWIDSLDCSSMGGDSCRRGSCSDWVMSELAAGALVTAGHRAPTRDAFAAMDAALAARVEAAQHP